MCWAVDELVEGRIIRDEPNAAVKMRLSLAGKCDETACQMGLPVTNPRWASAGSGWAARQETPGRQLELVTEARHHDTATGHPSMPSHKKEEYGAHRAKDQLPESVRAGHRLPQRVHSCDNADT